MTRQKRSHVEKETIKWPKSVKWLWAVTEDGKHDCSFGGIKHRMNLVSWLKGVPHHPGNLMVAIRWTLNNIISTWTRSELGHSPEVLACLEGAFPHLLRRPHHRRSHARHRCPPQCRCPVRSLHCATPRSCCPSASRIHSSRSVSPCRGPSSHAATSSRLGVAVCSAAYSAARPHNLEPYPLKHFNQEQSCYSLNQRLASHPGTLNSRAFQAGSTYEADMDTWGDRLLN